MQNCYTLSFSHTQTKGKESLRYWKIVRVSPMQVQAPITSWLVPPHHNEGELVKVVVSDSANITITLKREGAYYRELTSRELLRGGL